ncbi:MAG: hypothetical protein AAB397_01030 [Patescibacteria group bacterium]
MKDEADKNKDEIIEEWKVGSFEQFIVRIPPLGDPNLKDKVIEARIDPKLGVAQLKKYYYCNGWGGACGECGLCPKIKNVDRVDNKISNQDIARACDNFGEEGLRNILLQLKFPHNFSGPIYIPIHAGEYICARVSEGSIDVVGMDLVNNMWLDYHLEIDEFFFIISDKTDEAIKKQILIGLVKYARCLIGR